VQPHPQPDDLGCFRAGQELEVPYGAILKFQATEEPEVSKERGGTSINIEEEISFL
jgi:hypothetical protein